MGGTMEYLRFRHRNGLDWRPTEYRDSYPPADLPERALSFRLVLGDLNRFERDVMGVGYDGDALAQRYAEAAETDVETVRKVLRAVFESGWTYGIEPVHELPVTGGSEGSADV